VQVALPFGAQPRKPALRCNNQKGNNHYLMLRLALVSEVSPDKASRGSMGIYPLSFKMQKSASLEVNRF